VSAHAKKLDDAPEFGPAPGRAIYALIPRVMDDIGAVAKDRRNEIQKYKFRGIDQFLNACHGPMAKHGVFIATRVVDRQREERESGKGGTLLYTILTVEHRFYAPDGSHVDVVTVGEAMDSGDKSCNKAMSAALKYALIQTFAIPTDDQDADTETQSHEVRPRQAPSPAPAPAPSRPAPAVLSPAESAKLGPVQKNTGVELDRAAWILSIKLGLSRLFPDPTELPAGATEADKRAYATARSAASAERRAYVKRVVGRDLAFADLEVLGDDELKPLAEKIAREAWPPDDWPDWMVKP